MKIEKDDISRMRSKKKLLNDARIQLKTEFAGIDVVIDELINYVESWFIFPESQSRPLVVSLWGLTGIGKTSLVKRFSELIEMNGLLFHFDVGEYQGNENRLKHDFSRNLEQHQNKNIILVFDEFQIARTIAEGGEEQNISELRAIWELIDSGNLNALPDNYYDIASLFEFLDKINYCISNGVRVKDGYVVGGEDIYSKVFPAKHNDNITDMFDFDEMNSMKRIADTEKDSKKMLFVPQKYITIMFSNRQKEFICIDDLLIKLKTIDVVETIRFVNQTIDIMLMPKIYNFSKSLIFIIGNLDEVYAMNDQTDPDLDADLFCEDSKKITLIDVKKALAKRFRQEQISRLGNNHIIYPTLDSEAYAKIIDLNLNIIAKNIKDKFDVAFTFDNSVKSILYHESVFPAQGVRPVLTTIRHLIENNSSKVLSDIIDSEKNIKNVFWRYANDMFINSFYEYSIGNPPIASFEKKYNLKLKVNSLRESKKDEKQAMIAVHESGHAILSSLLIGILPKKVMSKTSSSFDGVCIIDLPDIDTKKSMMQHITMSLGGIAAERIIFGLDDQSCGAQKDIEVATQNAVRMIKHFGMSDLATLRVGAITSDNSVDSKYLENDGEYNSKIKSIMKYCLDEANVILLRNKTLLIKMAEYLSENSRMDQDVICQFMDRYAFKKDMPEKFVNKDEYYGFKSKITELSNSVKL